MKQKVLLSLIMLLSLSTLIAADGDKKTSRLVSDSTRYTEISGKLIDSKTETPVVFATVVLSGTSIATVSNADGEYTLKIPRGKESGEIFFTHLGYKNKSIKIKELASNPTLELDAVTVPIDEIVVKSVDPLELVQLAINNIRVNYSLHPEMQTSFYRETIKQNRKYVAVSEAVMDIYKAPYKASLDSDRIKIYKGRKSRDVKKMDTIVVKLQGGPRTSLLLDIVKNPGDILHNDMLQYYEFDLDGITSIDNRETYIVSFKQIEGIEYPLYNGNLYIDSETHAFAGMDFELSSTGLPYASDVLVKKKPNNLNIDITSGHYLVRYRQSGDEWYLNYVRSEIGLESKWKKKLFKNNFNLMLEMAVTDRSKENIDKFPNKESSKMHEIFAEEVESFENGNFWGEYNTIKPDESIEVAIEKLNKKLKKRY